MITVARAVILVCLMLAGSLPAAALDTGKGTVTTDTEVDYLLQFVADSDCIFVRNGRDHSAAEAADHLRLKYRRGRRYVSTAEDFINRLASESSWTGRPYTVRCGDSSESSSAWLHRALASRRS